METDNDLEGTGVTRHKIATRSSGQPPDTSAGEASGQIGEDFDPEELMETAQSVKPKEKSSLYEDLHSNFSFSYLFSKTKPKL